MSGNSLTFTLVLPKTQIKNIWHMAKVNIKSDKITPFWGIYYASKAFYALSLDKIINGTLGVRSSTYNDYQWDEIMSAMSDVFLCGGSYSEDIIRTVDGNCRIFYIRGIHSALSKRTTNVGRESATSTVSTMTSDGSICHAPSWTRTPCTWYWQPSAWISSRIS